jgi:hypothetical protein
MNRSCITQRGLVLLLVVSTFCPALYAGFKPEQHVIVQSEANGPTSVYAADLDGDGDLDVLSASYEDDKIAWYANDGTGRFGRQQVITTEADRANCVYAADLDGDGDLDVLSASATDNKIAWYANDGSGQFGPQQVITTEADGATCVYAADLDGDGDLDVLSASAADDTIAWYANDGTGQFGPQQVITTKADGARSVYAADLDGDGDLDVLSASEGDSTIAWYANDGTGHFGPQQVITTAANGANCVYAADLDGDGDLDVLATSHSPSWSYSKITWYANDGLGHFSPQQVITTGIYCAHCVYATDLDDDGDLDILSASNSHAGSGKIAWYANDGAGHFGPEQAISTAALYAYSVYAADLDGDGDLDVLSAFSRLDDKITWYANDGTGQFGSQRVVSPYPGGAQAVDLDRDGDLDVLSFSLDDHKVAWYANDGSGHFGPRQVIITEADWANCVRAADLDDDGDPDVLLWSGYPDGKIAWYASDGSGHFGPQQVVLAENWELSSLSAVDLDGDGDLDILVASPDWDTAEIAWCANDGAGGFGPTQVIAGGGADCAYAADLDGDGDLDVLAGAVWYANDGSGHFGPEQVITTAAPGTKCVYAADLDGDGDLDVLSASSVCSSSVGCSASKIAWYANDGSGGFGPQQVITTAADGAHFVSAADFDGDGDLDVLSGSHGSSGEFQTAWYANDGTGHFGPQQVITTVASGGAAVDLDGDGDLDLLSGGGSIVWYENEQVDRTTSSTSP